MSDVLPSDDEQSTGPGSAPGPDRPSADRRPDEGRPDEGRPDEVRLSCTAILWPVDEPSGWHFVTLPEDWNEDFRAARKPGSGFGSVRVRVRSGVVAWETSVFPDRRRNAYLLPMKRAVRDSLGLAGGDSVPLTVEIVS